MNHELILPSPFKVNKKGREKHWNQGYVRELIQHVPKPSPPPPHSCLEKAARLPPTSHLLFFLVIQHGNLFPFLQLPSEARPSVPQDPVTGVFSSTGLPTSNPSQSPCLLHFSKPSTHLVVPILTDLPPSNGIPRAWGVGSRTHAQHPSTNQLPPLLQQAPFMLAAPSPTPNAFVHFWP